MAAAEGPPAQTSTTSPAMASNGERGMARRSEEEDVLGKDGFGCRATRGRHRRAAAFALAGAGTCQTSHGMRL